MHSLFDNIEHVLGVFRGKWPRSIVLFDFLHDQILPCYFILPADEDDSHDLCKMLAAKLQTENEFPAGLQDFIHQFPECKQYNDAVSVFKRQDTSKSSAAYEGMSPGDAIDAMRARDEGHLNSAQIKRRMTGKKNGRVY